MLKKIKKIVLLIIILIPFKIMANPTIKIEYIDNVYSNRIIGDHSVTSKFGYIYVNGLIAFCIDPLEIVGNNYVINNELINEYYTEKEQRLIQLIIHYGISTHLNDPYYYMATQELIWRVKNVGDYYFTLTNSLEGEKIDIEYYKNEIMQKVNDHEILPSFSSQTITPKVNDNIQLEDKNNVLSRFFVSYSTKNEILKQGNLLNIKVLSKETDIINLTYNAISGIYSNVYVGNGQTLITSCINEIQNIKIKIEPSGIGYYFKISVKERETGSIYGKVKFKIFDLENAKYIQDGKEYETDNYGTYISNFTLNPGTYKIVYTELPNGYISPKIVNVFSISNNVDNNSNLIYDVISYIEVPQGKLNIVRDAIKYDGRSYLLNDIEYKIYAYSDIYNVIGEKLYSANELVDTIKITEGKTEKILPLGSYYVVEQFNNYGIDKHPVENISFIYDNSITDYYLTNLKITSKIPSLNMTLNTSKEEINGTFTPYSNFKYGLFAKEDIIYLNEVVFKKGDLVTEICTDKNGYFADTISIPYGTYEILELTRDNNYSLNNSIVISFNKENTNIDLNINKVLKRGHLNIKINSLYSTERNLKFIYNECYNYKIIDELNIKNIKIGEYKIILDKEYSVVIKENETTFLEIIILEPEGNDKFKEEIIDNSLNKADKSELLNNELVKIEKNEQFLNEKEINNMMNDNSISQNNSTIVEELPNATNYLKKYCYIFEVFLIAGIILKLSVKNH